MADSAVTEALILEHWGLAESMARSFAFRGRQPQWIDDLCSAALVGLWQTAARWDPECGDDFAVRAAAAMRSRLIDEWRHVHSGRPGHGAKPQTVAVSVDMEDTALGPEDVVVDRAAVGAILPQLRGRDGNMCLLHWVAGRSLRSIGDEFGVSESRVCQIVKRYRRRLRRLNEEDKP